VAEPSVTSAAALDTAAESWHDGLEEDFVTNMRQYRSAEDDDVRTVGEGDEENDDEVNLGHEGYVEGASIDQLAAAWAQAEEEAGADARRQQEYEFSDLSAPHPDEDALRRTNYFDEGMKHFDAGNMTEAIRAFETELRHVDADNSDAWRMLGRCHAENDQDRKAIACLERAVDRDPYSVEALLLLGTSYVNELDHPRALRNLKSWATHNPTYAGMELPSAEGAASPEERERTALEEAKKLLEKAIEVDPTQAADAMEALGVVCNVSREYDAAIDHFRKAIDLRPDDYQLHNKLGATLANSNRSDEALPAYHKALQLKPKYARAWLNMAISHANLHSYDEAARCYLQTLSLNPAATHVWSYLRIALTCAERWDLLPLAASQNLAGFKEHFDFVQY
jgi:peroxin-5